jgi:hypothetical protein
VNFSHRTGQQRKNDYRSMHQLVTQVAKGEKNVSFADIDFSHCWWDFRFAVWRRSNGFSQRLSPSSHGGKRICNFHAQHGRSGSVPGVHETPNEQCFRRRFNVLFSINRMAHRPTKGIGNEHLRLGRASGCHAIGATIVTYGVQKATGHAGLKDGVPAGMYFFLGSIALLAAAGDVRMLVRGGVFGTQRLARHLWRMCFALFIASGSFFLGPANRPLRLLRTVGLRQQMFAAILSKEVLLLLAILPLILMIFWLFRVRLANANKQKLMPRSGDVYSLPNLAFGLRFPQDTDRDSSRRMST